MNADFLNGIGKKIFVLGLRQEIYSKLQNYYAKIPTIDRVIDEALSLEATYPPKQDPPESDVMVAKVELRCKFCNAAGHTEEQ